MEFNCKYYTFSRKNTPLPFEKLYKTILIEHKEAKIIANNYGGSERVDCLAKFNA